MWVRSTPLPMGSCVISLLVSMLCSVDNRHSGTLMTLFSLMIPAGMPELNDMHDVEYLRQRLLLHLTDEAAADVFSREIASTLRSRFKRLDNTFHILKHL